MRSTLLVPLSALALALAGCGDDGMPVTIAFEGLVDGRPAACGESYAGIGSSAASYTLLDYRVYVHDVRLVTSEGTEVPVSLTQDGVWQHQGVALLDFEEGGVGCPTGSSGTNTAVRGTVATSATFTGLRFRVGVPFELNHADASAAPPPLNLTAMFWNWQGGYKFLRIDGATQGLASGYNLHLGSTGCDGNPLTGGTTACANPNRIDVSLDGFDPTTTPVELDVARVLASVDVDVNTMDTPPGCMSAPDDPQCAAIFPRLGLPYFGTAAGTQELFRVGGR